MRVNLAVGEFCETVRRYLACSDGWKLLTTLGGATRVAGLAGALTLGASGAAGAVTALLAGLMGVYLAVGELYYQMSAADDVWKENV